MVGEDIWLTFRPYFPISESPARIIVEPWEKWWFKDGTSSQSGDVRALRAGSPKRFRPGCGPAGAGLHRDHRQLHRNPALEPRVIDLDPGNADAHLGRANANADLGERRSALEDYDAAIRLAPGDAVAHYSRGACHAQLGNLAGAVSDFDVAILLAPDNADPWYNRGSALSGWESPCGRWRTWAGP